jgi:hypothetical protein
LRSGVLVYSGKVEPVPAPLAESGECAEHNTLYPDWHNGEVDFIEVFVE